MNSMDQDILFGMRAAQDENRRLRALIGRIAAANADFMTEMASYVAEADRLRAGLQLIADDTHGLMNEIARQTANSILAGKNP
jgi:hypothetical protein